MALGGYGAMVMTVHVVLAEDNALLREGLLGLLRGIPGIEVDGWASDASGLDALVDQHRPDVVVTDIRMPPGDDDEGVRAARRYRDAFPDMGVVVLSQHASPRYAMDLLGDGSAGRAYLLKHRVRDASELASAIETVAAGGSVVDPAVVDLLVAARSGDTSPLRWLTPRELEVLAAMAQGKSNAAIAQSLGLSVRAVEKHASAIFSKLGVTEEPDANRRVRAVLLYLDTADVTRGAGSSP